MTQVKTFAFGTIVGAGLVFTALQYHLIQSRDGFRLVPRSPQHSIGLAYADVRDWDTAQWADRPELMKALVAHGSTDLVTQSVTGDLVDAASSAIESGTGGIDHMREMLDSFPGSGEFESPSDGLTIPSFDDIMPADFDSDDGSTVPFPSSARNKTIDTARRDDVDRSRNLLDDISSAGTGLTESLKPKKNSKSNAGSRVDPFRRSVRSSVDAYEQNRFSNSSTDRTGSATDSYADRFSSGNSSPNEGSTESTDYGSLFDERGSDDDSENGGSSSSPKDNEADFMGMFEEVSSALEREAEESLSEVRSRVRSRASDYMSETARDTDRYVRDRVKESLPDSVSSIFSDESSSSLAPFEREPAATNRYGSGSTIDEDLPSALRAIKNGFDPFID